MLDRQSGDSVSKDNPRSNDNDDSEVYGKYNACISHGHNDSGGASRFFYCAKASVFERNEGLEGTGFVNNHPTVKPVDLMQYLVRLVTPPGGIMLDPFMGSGTTGKAAAREGFKFIGIEEDKHNEGYLPLALARIKAPAQVELL